MRAIALNVVPSPSVLYGMHTAAGRVFRPLHIDLITGKPISAHPGEAAAESQQSYGRDHKQQLQVETSLKHDSTFHVATIGRTCARRYGSHVAFCMVRLAYFLARRGQRLRVTPLQATAVQK
jgi:hypothetical protein